MPENEEAYQVFTMVKDNYIMGSDGPISVNNLAIEHAMELLGIEDKRDVFFRVKNVSQKMITRTHQKRIKR